MKDIKHDIQEQIYQQGLKKVYACKTFRYALISSALRIYLCTFVEKRNEGFFRLSLLTKGSCVDHGPDALILGSLKVGFYSGK